jgi:hypothetical protein
LSCRNSIDPPWRARHPHSQRIGKIGLRGVRKHGSRWRALIFDGIKLRHLGVFSTPEAASKAVAVVVKRREVDRLLRMQAADKYKIARTVVELIELSIANPSVWGGHV